MPAAASGLLWCRVPSQHALPSSGHHALGIQGVLGCSAEIKSSYPCLKSPFLPYSAAQALEGVCVSAVLNLVG